MVIGTSPDGKVQTQTNPDPYLVEIKWRNYTIMEACKAKDFCCYLDSNKVQLKQNHRYYTQIQGQMGVCQYKLCHLVLYTLQDLTVIKNPIQCNVLGFTSRKIKNFLHKICYAMFEIKLNCEKNPIKTIYRV